MRALKMCGRKGLVLGLGAGGAGGGASFSQPSFAEARRGSAGLLVNLAEALWPLRTPGLGRRCGSG